MSEFSDPSCRALSRARRIVIVGSSGSGKSTLAIQLGEALRLPVCHLDVLWWRPGWVEAGEKTFDADLGAVVESDSWVIDGNYSRTLEMRLERADAAVMLDFPRTLCLYRALKRRLVYAGRSRPDMAPGCPEKMDWEFIRWIWDYPGRSRQRVFQALRSFGETKTFVHIERPRDVQRLLDGLSLGSWLPSPQPSPARGEGASHRPPAHPDHARNRSVTS